MASIDDLARHLVILEDQEDLSQHERVQLQTLKSAPEVQRRAEVLREQPEYKGQVRVRQAADQIRTGGGANPNQPPSPAILNGARVRGAGAPAPGAQSLPPGPVLTSLQPGQQPPPQPGAPAPGTQGPPTATKPAPGQPGGGRRQLVKPVMRMAEKPRVDEDGKVMNWMALAAPLLGLGAGAIAQRWGGARGGAGIGFAAGAKFGESYFTSKRQRELDQEARLERSLDRDLKRRTEVRSIIQNHLANKSYQAAIDAASESGNPALQDQTYKTAVALQDEEEKEEVEKGINAVMTMAGQSASDPDALANLASQLRTQYADSDIAQTYATFLEGKAATTDKPANVQDLKDFNLLAEAIHRATSVSQLAGIQSHADAILEPGSPLIDTVAAMLGEKTVEVEKVEKDLAFDKGVLRITALQEAGLWGSAAKAANDLLGTSLTAEDMEPNVPLAQMITRIFERIVRDYPGEETKAMEIAEQAALAAKRAQEKEAARERGEEDEPPSTGPGYDVWEDVDPKKVREERKRAEIAKAFNITPEVMSQTDDMLVAKAVTELQKFWRKHGRWGDPVTVILRKVKEEIALLTELTGPQKTEAFNIWKKWHARIPRRPEPTPGAVPPHIPRRHRR